MDVRQVAAQRQRPGDVLLVSVVAGATRSLAAAGRRVGWRPGAETTGQQTGPKATRAQPSPPWQSRHAKVAKFGPCSEPWQDLQAGHACCAIRWGRRRVWRAMNAGSECDAAGSGCEAAGSGYRSDRAG